jgi:hypothetical protein
MREMRFPKANHLKSSNLAFRVRRGSYGVLWEAKRDAAFSTRTLPTAESGVAAALCHRTP